MPFNPQKPGHYQHKVTENHPLLRHLQHLTQNRLTQKTLKQLLKNGSVWLQTPNRKPERTRRAKKPLTPGQTLHLYYHPQQLIDQPPNPTCLADYGDYSLWYKPKGMASQGSKWGDAHTLYRWVEMHDTAQRPAFIIHRLDKHTDGIMLLAHKKHTASQLSQSFEKRQIKKGYLAWVTGTFPLHKQSCTLPIAGKNALSWLQGLYHHQHNTTPITLIHIHIETGRKHQIRRHCAALGHPIIGDRLYNPTEKWTTLDMQLTNYLLSFPCPITQQTQTFNLTQTPQWQNLINLNWKDKLKS